MLNPPKPEGEFVNILIKRNISPPPKPPHFNGVRLSLPIPRSHEDVPPLPQSNFSTFRSSEDSRNLEGGFQNSSRNKQANLKPTPPAELPTIDEESQSFQPSSEYAVPIESQSFRSSSEYEIPIESQSFRSSSNSGDSGIGRGGAGSECSIRLDHENYSLRSSGGPEFDLDSDFSTAPPSLSSASDVPTTSYTEPAPSINSTSPSAPQIAPAKTKTPRPASAPPSPPVIQTFHQGNSEKINLTSIHKDDIKDFSRSAIKKISKIDLEVKKVKAYNAKKLNNIEEVGYLPHLKSLDLRNCKNLTEFPTSMTRMIECPKEHLGTLIISLQELILKNTGIRKLPNMSTQEILEIIDISGSQIPNSEISSFKDLPDLKELDISDCKRKEIPQLPNQLIELKCRNTDLKSLESIQNLTNLQKLDVSHNKSLEDFSPISVTFADKFRPWKGVKFSLSENNLLDVKWEGTKAQKKWEKARKKWAGWIEKNENLDRRPLGRRDLEKWQKIQKDFADAFKKTEPNWFQKRIPWAKSS